MTASSLHGRLIAVALALAFAAGCSQAPTLSDCLPPGSEFPEVRAGGWLNGEPSPGDLAGKVRVVTVWAYWCPPCRAEAPHLADAYKRFHDEGVEFLGLTSEGETTLADSKEFLSSAGITYPNGYDAGKTIEALKVYGIPAVFVVGRDNKIVWNNRQNGSLEEAIEKALASTSA